MSDDEPQGYGNMAVSEVIDMILEDEECPYWATKILQGTPTDRSLFISKYRRRTESRKTTPREPQTNYERYLATPHWQVFRLAVLTCAGGLCFRCGKEAGEVHHVRYKDEGGSIRFRERAKDVIPICRSCHELEHHKPIKAEPKPRIMDILKWLARRERENRK